MREIGLKYGTYSQFEIDRIKTLGELEHYFWQQGQYTLSDCAKRLIEEEEQDLEDWEGIAEGYRCALSEALDSLENLRDKYQRVPIAKIGDVIKLIHHTI